MTGRRELSVSEMLNVVFFSSGVTRACLNEVGKVPVRRDVLNKETWLLLLLYRTYSDHYTAHLQH